MDFPPFPLSLRSIIFLLSASEPTRCMNGLFVGISLSVRRLFAKSFGNVSFTKIEDALLAISVEIGYALLCLVLFFGTAFHTLGVELFFVKPFGFLLQRAELLHLLLHRVLVGIAFVAIIFKSKHMYLLGFA